jgi:glutaredoxin
LLEEPASGKKQEVPMKPLAFALLLALVAGAQAGQLYRWTDEQGRVHYTDQPPPRTAKSAEVKKLGDKPADPNLPYALQMAIRNYPVTLYNADCGEVCTKASALLSKRGVPYSDRNARDEQVAEALEKLTGKREVPVLVVGKEVVRGFQDATWHAALDAAGYPKTAVLPPRATKQPAKQQAAAVPAQASEAAQPAAQQ